MTCIKRVSLFDKIQAYNKSEFNYHHIPDSVRYSGNGITIIIIRAQRQNDSLEMLFDKMLGY